MIAVQYFHECEHNHCHYHQEEYYQHRDKTGLFASRFFHVSSYYKRLCELREMEIRALVPELALRAFFIFERFE